MTNRACTAVAVAGLVAGCGVGSPWRHAPADGPARQVARAEDLAQDGKPREARALYEQVLKGHPDDPVAAEALYGLGRLQVEPGPEQNYRAARATFARVIADYPETRWAREAAAWRAVLNELERRDAETTKLRGDLERLKQLDIQMERRR
jgi:tetratricopeptide (TPR) repeat protein